MSESWAGPWETRNAKTNHPKWEEGQKMKILRLWTKPNSFNLKCILIKNELNELEYLQLKLNHVDKYLNTYMAEISLLTGTPTLAAILFLSLLLKGLINHLGNLTQN